MAPSARAHARSHSLLLVQKLLNLRDGASPLTLLLDSLEQSAGPLLGEYASRAKIGRSRTVFVSFATAKQPRYADVLVKGRNKSLEALSGEIASHRPPANGSSANDGQSPRVLIIIDCLNPLAASHPAFISAFLSSLITPSASVVAVYHTDVPLVAARTFAEYEPHPLTVLCHLATAVLRVSSLWQAVERRRARDRSLQEPEWGLQEGREGVLIGVKPEERGARADGLVLDMEMRRRSGRSVIEKFVLSPRAKEISLLSDHPLFAPPADPGEGRPAVDEANGDEMEMTFDLGITEKQRRDREGVVLPYFDAQTDIGAGQGGRILYEMGREDDFDDEEDEI